MSISLTDGSIVGDGSQIGMFPVLADQLLDKPSILLRSASNPRMDLVLLLIKDAASQTSSTAAAKPPGMPAAQFALVQRMLAARQRGAQAAAGKGVPEPKRGPQIHLVLWRMGDDSSVVWSVPLSFDKVMDLAPTAQEANQQEHEDVHLHDIAWSPKGDRVAALASVRRSPVASSSIATSRTATFLRTYSVQDGRLLSTTEISGGDTFADPMFLQWLDIDFAVATDSVDGSSENLISKLPPLPELPAADTFASMGGSANLMPHQLRMMQMSGQKSPPSFQFPSHLAMQGRGPLAKLPYLAKANAQLGLIDGGDTASNFDDEEALPLAPETVVLASRPASAQASLILDGQTNIGSLQPLQRSGGELEEFSLPFQSLSLSRDMTSLTSVSVSSNGTLHYNHLRLPLPITTRYGPSSIRRKISAVSRACHLLHFYLGYALDSASAMQQVYQKDFVEKVTAEWTKNVDDLGIKFGGDMKYELINVLLTGRAGPAAEQFLLGNLTEGVLARLEQQSHNATYALKKLVSESLRPALERCIICVSEMLGQVRFFGQDERGLQEVLKVLQATLGSALSLAKEVDMEALISQEFYRWCRTERERQERIKQDQDEPRLPITYDVHFVANYIDRGFENDDIQARMSNGLSTDALERLLSDPLQKPSLQDALEEAKTFWAVPEAKRTKWNAQQKESGAGFAGRKATLAIVPALTKAIEMLGEQLVRLLDAELEHAQVVEATSINSPALQGEWRLMRESAPALSLSSDVAAEERSDRTCAVLFLSSETLLSAYVLRPHASEAAVSTPILVTRQSNNTAAGDKAAVVETAKITIPSRSSNLSILDLGFYGDSELLVLASLHSSSTLTSVLLAFPVVELSWNIGTVQEVVPSRATEFEPGFKAGKLAVNTNKQTVAVLDEEGKRVVYLDISRVGELGEDVAMLEE